MTLATEVPSSNSDAWQIAIYDLKGKLYKSFLIRDAPQRLDLREWPAATYQIIGGKGNTSKQTRFVKQ